MAQFEQHFVQDLTQQIKVRHCGSIVFNADNESNVVSVRLFNGSEPVAISGSVVGAVVCSDGSTVPLTGSYSGNTASITLTGDCFAVLGQIGVGIQIVNGTQKTTVLKVIYNVETFSTDDVVDPGSRITLSVSDLIDDIETAVASIPADYSDLLAAIAPNYSDLTYPVKKGQLCWYDGTLYSAKEPIASTSSWDSTKWQSATVDGAIPKNIADGTGEGAIAEGRTYGTNANVASGACAHAEGIKTTASGFYSHAEGEMSVASGYSTHAEGNVTTASGDKSHAEGYHTTASGWESHAEGEYTVSNHRNQHVFGAYNTADDSSTQPAQKGNYVEIVGNGTADNARSNARTLDWSGNEALSGDLTINKNGQNEMTVGEELSDLKSAYDSHSSTAEIRHKSYDFKINRYNNITYYDRMLYSTLAKGTATEIGVNTDYTWQGRPYSIYFKTDPSATYSECRINYSTAFKLLGTQEIDIAVYVPDATKVTNIRVSVPSADFVKSSTQMGQTIVNGWNFIRLMSEGAGTWSEDTDNTQIRVLATHSSGAAETLYIGYLMQVVPNYANLILIADGPYYTFFTEAYPALKTMGVPVTWALDPELITDSTSEDRQLINNSDLETLANDGISEFSFHSFDGTIMSNASAEDALADTLKSIRYLKQHGIEPERIFRAAWLQNSCAHPELANLELDASASYNGANGVTIYPFMNKFNIPRIGLANRATSYIDELFKKMRMQHCTILAYFHGISTDSDTEVTPTMLTYILESIQTAITAGYLNPTTYNRLVSYYSKIE